MNRSNLRVIVAMSSLIATLGLSSCSSSSCGTGADSATDAVTGFLEAGAKKSPTKADVCQYVHQGKESEALDAAREAHASITSAGGVSQLNVDEQAARQMGAEYVVSVSTTSEVVAEYVVTQDDGAFYVMPGVSPSDPE